LNEQATILRTIFHAIPRSGGRKWRFKVLAELNACMSLGIQACLGAIIIVSSDYGVQICVKIYSDNLFREPLRQLIYAMTVCLPYHVAVVVGSKLKVES